jgi:hypothetical protein
VNRTLTRFFLPGRESKRVGTEAAYESLRAGVNDESGHGPHARRIQTMLCRRKGKDTKIVVGDSNEAIAGQTVVAILQVGRESYTIHCEATASGRPSTIELDRHSVYSVSDFDS